VYRVAGIGAASFPSTPFGLVQVADMALEEEITVVSPKAMQAA
jgi:hypothetical protein